MMVIRPTAEQTRRALRKRTYSGPGFGPRSFDCIGLGIGLGIGLSSGASGSAAPIVFSTLGWTGLGQLFQSDIGLVYDTSLVATSGNTSTTALSITNSGSTAPCAVMAKATNTLAIGSGAQFSIYTDGGTTPIMTGVTPTAATPIALTGFSGVALTWTAGTSVTNDTWKAAAATWNDQAPTPHNGSATGTARPIISPGTGGKLSLAGNGTTTRLATTYVMGAAPATQNQYIYLLGRMTATPAGTAALVAAQGGTAVGLYCGAGTLNVQQYNGSFANGSVATVNTWYLWAAKFTGSTSDSLQLGSAAPVSVASAGNAAPSTGTEYFGPAGAFFCPIDIAMVAIATSPAPAGFRAAITTWCGVTNV